MKMKIAYILLVVSFLGVQSIFSQVPDPVKHWNFNSDPETIDGKYRMVTGVEGKALKLDGFTSVISEKPDVLADLNSSFTIESWIAMAAYPWNWCPVITQMKEETGGFSFEVGPRGEIALKMHIGNNIINCISDETLPLREWKHIAAVYEAGKGISLFMNGVKVAEYISTGKPLYGSKQEVRIGMNYEAVFPSNRIGDKGITPYWFSIDGIIDELKVYSDALSSEQIKS